MVSLAKRLEGRPFHLLAAHCQSNPKEEVVAYIKSKGLAANSPNFTVTSFGGHPKVKGNGFVPYYMVFDQHGKLAQHHMCGGYHGGDGLAMIEWVDKLLKETPDIYLGEEAFTAVPKLAKQVGKRKNLAAAVKEIEKKRETAGRAEKAEFERLYAAVTRYRDRMLGRAESLMATDPSQVVPHMTALDKDLKGTSLAVTDKLAEYKKSPELKRSIAIAKKFAKLQKRIEKQDPGKRRDKEVRKLTALAAEAEGLPIQKTISDYAAGL